MNPVLAVYTDALQSYEKLNSHFAHEAINHAVCYVKDRVHTNGLENFWSLLKLYHPYTYVSVEPFHLFRYLDEQAFRFNERKNTDAGRFLIGIVGVIGKRLKYAKLISEPAQAMKRGRQGRGKPEEKAHKRHMKCKTLGGIGWSPLPA